MPADSDSADQGIPAEPKPPVPDAEKPCAVRAENSDKAEPGDADQVVFGNLKQNTINRWSVTGV